MEHAWLPPPVPPTNATLNRLNTTTALKWPKHSHHCRITCGSSGNDLCVKMGPACPLPPLNLPSHPLPPPLHGLTLLPSLNGLESCAMAAVTAVVRCVKMGRAQPPLLLCPLAHLLGWLTYSAGSGRKPLVAATALHSTHLFC